MSASYDEEEDFSSSSSSNDSLAEPDVAESDTPAQPEELTPCQAAIVELLSVPNASVQAACDQLRPFEVEERLPSTIKSRQLLAKAALPVPRNSGICFDLSSPTPSWCAHTLCARCDGINQLSNSIASNRSSIVSQGTMSVALLLTKCVARPERRRSDRPALPLELIEIIVLDFLSEDNDEEEEYGALDEDEDEEEEETTVSSISPRHFSVLYLLHSSSFIRRFVTKHLSHSARQGLGEVHGSAWEHQAFRPELMEELGALLEPMV